MNKFEKILNKDAIYINKKVDLSELCGKKILITGASGLIGINFLMSLKEFSRKKSKKNTPTIIAIFNREIPNYFRGIVNFENLQIKKGDITDINFVNSLGRADYIIHAAGYGQPGKFLQDKIKTIAINTTATMSLLKKLNSDGKFLFISTSEIYSGLSDTPFKESQVGTTNTTHPRSCYIESKRCGETICHTYYEMGKMVKSARLSLAYGPGTKSGDTRVLNSFIEKGLTGKIEMIDKGKAKRTYCYVRDAIEMLWNILLFGKGPIYNVGGKSKTTIKELAEKIGNQLHVPVSFPKRSDHKLKGAPDNVLLDMTMVKDEFGKTNYVSLSEGLKSAIAWQKELAKEK
jgi:nucleoside-diphosphate-sugar epimerase